MLHRRYRALGLAMSLGLGLFSVEAQATTQRALLIGINDYESGAQETGHRHWRSLEGTINDVEVMAELLVGRYKFDKNNVWILRNGEATREAMLGNIRKHLIEPAAPGDVCVFYFAGHGSQVRNSRSDESDGFDETLVPADANRGVRDIRDKELRRLFNDVVDKGALLTVIFDSCHSTSAQRGVPGPLRLRSLEPDERDIADLIRDEKVDSRGDPADRGALVIAASQEFERAAEVVDGQGTPHGLFSLALTSVLRSAPVTESAQQTFLRIRATMKAHGHAQEPSLQGNNARLAAVLFGGALAPGAGNLVAAVQKIREDGRLELQGGLALGLYPGSVLRRVVSEPERGAPSDVTVRIHRNEAFNRSLAEIVTSPLAGPKRAPRAGDATPESNEPADAAASGVQVGDLFELTNWVAPAESYLRVRIPPAMESLALEAAETWIAETRKAMATSGRARWISDPSVLSPSHVLSWDGSSWQMTSEEHVANLGRSPTVLGIVENLVCACEPSLFVQVPPPVGLANALGFDTTGPVEITDNPLQAQYLLAGRATENGYQYSWMLPNATDSDVRGVSPLPVRSKWFAAEEADSLRQKALVLARVRSWLQLVPPPDDGLFPYTLQLRHAGTKEILTSDVVVEGDSFEVVLQANQIQLARALEHRYVYVFVLDSDGKSTCLYPRGGDVTRLPPDPPDTTLPLGGRFHVSRPFGVDTYILVTTTEPIPAACEVFSWEGVRGSESNRGRVGRTRGGLSSALEQFLDQFGAGRTRGLQLSTPASWSLQRLPVRSVGR